ncbi:hypothetical protein GXM_03513 [Nostoc sphaeroides CCNUC1]|uniref:Uncharacterized protein n=1 Tax=Nostoc sphaeroides CCNUC1 TaxID=2653204 RepID=A0A5P8W025_9NOSO|nr:hypothetical protein GXM_03513 [Nostoc sphaeroides CCNUC1]
MSIFEIGYWWLYFRQVVATTKKQFNLLPTSDSTYIYIST